MIIFADSIKKGECIFLILDKEMDRESFLSRLGVREGSYAWELGCRLYEAFFPEAVNVIDEYHKYYKLEYTSLIEYIASEYGLETTSLQVIDDQITEDKLVLYTEPYSSCEDWFASFILTDSMRRTLQELFNGE